jgi:hypothetical protein
MPEKDENWRGYIKEHINNCTISNINNNKDNDYQENIKAKVTLLLKNATNIKNFQKKFSQHHLVNEEITETLEAMDDKIQNNKTLILNSGKATSGITALAFNFIIGGLTVPHIGIVIGIYLGFKYLADKFEENSNTKTKWRDYVTNNIKNIKEYNNKFI